MDHRSSPPVRPPSSDVATYGEGSPFQAASPEPLLTRAAPVAGDLSRYSASSERRDLIAGVTVAALPVPSTMAYAEVAGVSPVNGRYALLLPTVAYVLLGSSRKLVVGPEGSSSTRDDITLVVARLRTRIHERFDLSGLTGTIGPEHFYPSAHAAVDELVQSQAAPA